MNASNGNAAPSSEFGGRAVLEEAVEVARVDLEAEAELHPFVVTKAWGDCEVERFTEGLDQARSRMDELLHAGSSIGHCALVHLGDADDGQSEVVIELGRVGEEGVEVFSQRFRPHGGLFRRFKLIGEPSRVAEGERPLATA